MAVNLKYYTSITGDNCRIAGPSQPGECGIGTRDVPEGRDGEEPADCSHFDAVADVRTPGAVSGPPPYLLQKFDD